MILRVIGFNKKDTMSILKYLEEVLKSLSWINPLIETDGVGPSDLFRECLLKELIEKYHINGKKGLINYPYEFEKFA